MDVRRVRAVGASLVTVAADWGWPPRPALAAPGVSVSAVSSLKAGATAGTLTGTVVNDTEPRDARGGRRPAHAPRHATRRSIGRTTVKVAAHSSAAYRVARQAAGRPDAGQLLPRPPARRTARGAGALGCATAQRRRADQGRHAGARHAGRRARWPGPRRPPPAAPAGARWPSRARACTRRRATPATPACTPTSTSIYDAPSNLFLPGTHVDLQQRATQCLTEFSLDFERTNAVTSTTVPGPNLTVASVTINGQPATFTFKQPTYPGDPNGQDDPDPLAHAASNSNPVSATNPNPPACAPIGTGAALQGAAVPREQARDHAVGADPGRQRLQGHRQLHGPPRRPRRRRRRHRGLVPQQQPGRRRRLRHHRARRHDGLDAAQQPPDGQADVRLLRHDQLGRGGRHRPHGDLQRPPDRLHRQRRRTRTSRGGSRTWHWKSPEPIANYLVENSVGNYDADRAPRAQRRRLLRGAGRRASPPRTQGHQPGDHGHAGRHHELPDAVQRAVPVHHQRRDHRPPDA